MPKGKFKSITMSKHVVENLDLTCEKANYQLKKILEEKEKLQRFASQITKVPETVRVYSNPLMEKQRKIK